MRFQDVRDGASSSAVWETVFSGLTVSEFLRAALKTGQEWQTALQAAVARHAGATGLDGTSTGELYLLLERHIVELVLRGASHLV